MKADLQKISWSLTHVDVKAWELQRDVADIKRGHQGLELTADLKIDIAVGDILETIKESEDRVVERVVKKIEERDQQQMFAAGVKRQAAAMSDSGVATSTPVASRTASFIYPVVADSTASTSVAGASNVHEDVKSQVKRLQEEHEKEKRRIEARNAYLQEVIEDAKERKKDEEKHEGH